MLKDTELFSKSVLNHKSNGLYNISQSPYSQNIMNMKKHFSPSPVNLKRQIRKFTQIRPTGFHTKQSYSLTSSPMHSVSSSNCFEKSKKIILPNLQTIEK